MVKFENECVDCGQPCLGYDCPYRNVPHYFCDECQDEFECDELFFYDGDALCIDCIKGKLEKAYL